jgi:hypothetical protein
MSQYTASQTTTEGLIVNTVLDTESNTTTYTVTAPNGTVATNTQSADLSGSTTANLNALNGQLTAGGADVGSGIGILRAVRDSTTDVKTQATQATTEAEATNTPPPAEKQAIPVSTVTNPETPQPTANETPTANTAEPVTTETTTTTTNNEVDSTAAATVDDGTDALRAAAAEADDVVAENNQEIDDQDPFEASRQAAEDAYNAQEPESYDAADLGIEEDGWLKQKYGEVQQYFNRSALQSEDSKDAASEAAFRQRAKEQATLQARYKQNTNNDWRLRLSLADNADYLYKAPTGSGGPGILAPLAATKGVIFPYTPSINTAYKANYNMYDLIHSNYRGIFYKNSRVDDVQIKATFTAQDTTEAAYMLAVIHFFRSVTKMFYGQDPQRGTPPPLVYLTGYGDWQFSKHPCVVSNFTYSLPNDVDYIRATAPNNYGTNLLNRRTPVQSAPGGIAFAGAIRLANALLPKGAQPESVDPGLINQNVNNLANSTYVPTKMEIDITLIPVQTRSQVSKQFSLRDFANGKLIKGGFW